MLYISELINSENLFLNMSEISCKVILNCDGILTCSLLCIPILSQQCCFVIHIVNRARKVMQTYLTCRLLF